MPNKLKDMKIKEISAVTKGANRKQWVIVKSDEGDQDILAADDILKVAVEALGIAINKTVQEHDDPDEGDITKMQGDIEASFEEFADFAKDAMVGSFMDNIGRKNLRERLWGATDALYEAIQATLSNPDIDKDEKSAAVEQDLEDFAEWISGQLFNSKVAKAGAVISSDRLRRLKETHSALGAIITEAEGVKAEPDKGDVQKGDDTEVKAEEISKMVDDALQPIIDRLDSLEKSGEGEEKGEDMAQVVTDAIAKAMEPIAQRLEVIEKAKGIKKSIDGQEDEDKNVKKSFWGGIL